MSTDKTPEDQAAPAQANELDEAQLDKVSGGVIAIAVTAEPPDPGRALTTPPPDPIRTTTTRSY